nr:recombinase family protein [Streptomyces sp. NBC_00830]WTB35876.1 recombinase family protein [Streptomyces sp. NBC_00830]
MFEDEGHSGATLVRPALERLRDLVAQVGVDVVLCYAPDRLARKFAYQALLIEEFARAGTRVEFVRGPRGDSPEDQLMVQFQGMFAEYEKAQLMERYRRGKTYRARSGAVNVLGGAPFGYRYLRKTPECGATYEIVESEAALVVELFRRYTDDGASIADLTRWLTGSGTPTRTGKTRWDRSVVSASGLGRRRIPGRSVTHRCTVHCDTPTRRATFFVEPFSALIRKRKAVAPVGRGRVQSARALTDLSHAHPPSAPPPCCRPLRRPSALPRLSRSPTLTNSGARHALT